MAAQDIKKVAKRHEADRKYRLFQTEGRSRLTISVVKNRTDVYSQTLDLARLDWYLEAGSRLTTLVAAQTAKLEEKRVKDFMSQATEDVKAIENFRIRIAAPIHPSAPAPGPEYLNPAANTANRRSPSSLGERQFLSSAALGNNELISWSTETKRKASTEADAVSGESGAKKGRSNSPSLTDEASNLFVLGHRPVILNFCSILSSPIAPEVSEIIVMRCSNPSTAPVKAWTLKPASSM